MLYPKFPPTCRPTDSPRQKRETSAASKSISSLWVIVQLLKSVPNALFVARAFQRYPIWLVCDEKIFQRNIDGRIFLHRYCRPSPLRSPLPWPSDDRWLRCRADHICPPTMTATTFSPTTWTITTVDPTKSTVTTINPTTTVTVTMLTTLPQPRCCSKYEWGGCAT